MYEQIFMKFCTINLEISHFMVIILRLFILILVAATELCTNDNMDHIDVILDLLLILTNLVTTYTIDYHTLINKVFSYRLELLPKIWVDLIRV